MTRCNPSVYAKEDALVCCELLRTVISILLYKLLHFEENDTKFNREASRCTIMQSDEKRMLDLF